MPVYDPPSTGGGVPADTVTAETTFGASSAAGAATTYSRGDHTHGTPSSSTLATLADPTFTGSVELPAVHGTVGTVTVTNTGNAIPITVSVVEVTTDGDSDVDVGTLANGTVGQVIDIYVKVVGNAADSFTLTPATMLGGTSIEFGKNPLGCGCRLVYTASGWCVVGMYSRKTSQIYAALANDTLAQNYAVNTVTKLTVTAARTLTTTVPPAGCTAVTIILTSGTSAYTITFGSGFKPTGTLSTGTTTGRVFCIHWISDGTNLYENGRTAAMAA